MISTTKPYVLASYDKDTLKKGPRKLLLAGETVFTSLHPSIPFGFVRLLTRATVSGLLASIDRNTPKVYISVDERLYESAKARFALAFEGYLSWGLRECRKGSLVLFGGAETTQATNVQILVFTSGRLVELDEKMLPELSATYFKDAMQDMIAELRVKYPTARMVQAAPLSSWGVEGVDDVGDKPIRRLFYRSLWQLQSTQTLQWIPYALVVLSILFYVGILAKGWGMYKLASDFYDIESSDHTLKAHGGINPSLLSMMSARRDYMNVSRRQAVVTDKAAMIVRGIAAIPNVRIIELKFPVPSSDADQAKTDITLSPEQLKQMGHATPKARSPDVWMVLAVPLTQEAAVAQAKSIMTLIADHTELSLRLAYQGWQEDNHHRTFKIEGFLHE